jgi:hypothetical protein
LEEIGGRVELLPRDAKWIRLLTLYHIPRVACDFRADCPIAACYCLQRLLTIRLSPARSILATVRRPGRCVPPENVDSRV